MCKCIVQKWFIFTLDNLNIKKDQRTGENPA